MEVEYKLAIFRFAGAHFRIIESKLFRVSGQVAFTITCKLVMRNIKREIHIVAHPTECMLSNV